MSDIYIAVPIKPEPFARAGSHGKTRFTPTKQANFMGQIRMFANTVMAGRAPLQGPLSMTIDFTYVRPKSWTQKKVIGSYWKTSIPDVDNLAKIVEDALSGCVYEDDAQIAMLHVSKTYADKAAVYILVSTLDNFLEAGQPARLDTRIR